MREITNRTALITGGSSGLGAEFAEQLAQRGYDLVLVARAAPRLQRVAAHVRTAHRVRVDVITQDLTAPRAADRISAWLASHGHTVDLLVNSAGFGTVGRFEEIPPGQDRDQLPLRPTTNFGPGELPTAIRGKVHNRSTERDQQ